MIICSRRARAVPAHRGAGCGAARSTSGRGSSTRSSSSPARRSSTRSTSRAARSSTPRSGWRRTPTSCRSRASPSSSAGSPRRRPALGSGTAAPALRLGRRRVRRRDRAALRAAVSAAWDDEPRAAGRAGRASWTASASPADDRLLSIDAAGFKYWTGRPGVVTPDDPIETIESVAPRLRHALARPRARRHRPGARAGPRRRPRPAWIGAAGLRRPGRRTAARRPRAVPGLPRPTGDARCASLPLATRRRAVSRREAVLSAARRLRRRPRRPGVVAAQIVFPTPEDMAYYVGVARNLVEGRGLVADAIWSFGTPPLAFPRPAFEVWLPLPSFLAAIPMALFGDDVRRRAARRRSRRLARRRPRLAARPPTSPRSAALPARAGPGRWRSAPG